MDFFFFKLNIFLKIEEIAPIILGIIFVHKATPKSSNKSPKPNNISVNPNDKREVKKFVKILKNPTQPRISAAKNNVAKTTKTLNPKTATTIDITNNNIDITKIIGNQIGKNIIFINNSSIFLPLFFLIEELYLQKDIEPVFQVVYPTSNQKDFLLQVDLFLAKAVLLKLWKSLDNQKF